LYLGVEGTRRSEGAAIVFRYKFESSKARTLRTLSVGWQAFAAVVAIAAILTVAGVVQTLANNERTRNLDVRGSGNGITVRASLAGPDNHGDEVPPPKEAKRP
jgi:hypothetical protein